mmetsp:Transcript_120422/g.351752  ORF Transcript_120422/g.351752 Transcript_120422/m.351752 type:complete len:231 (-) Transcript_120422:248-940(-)
MQLLHGTADGGRGPAVLVDAFAWAVAIDQHGRHLVLQDVEDAARGVLRDVQVLEGLVGSGLASTELRAGEEVVHGLCIGGGGALARRLAELEINRSAVAHLLPRVCRDDRLAQLGVRGERDLAGRHELRGHKVQARPRHAQDAAGLVGDVAVAVGVAVQPARVQHDLDALGGLEAGGRVALRAHHELGEGVAAVAGGVLLKQRQRLVLDLRPAVALDELNLKLALLVLED